MTISEYIRHLERIKAEHGDLHVRSQTLTHLWDAEPPVLREESEWASKDAETPTSMRHYVLVNP